MKKFRNFISILLVCCLAVSLTLCAFAETVSDAKLIKTDDCELPGGDDSVITTGVYGEPMPFYVDFGSGEWNVDGITVTATIDGVELSSGPVYIGDWAVIKLENIDSSKMQVRVYAEDGFSALLEINGDGEVSLGRIIGDFALPPELSFVVEPFDENQHHDDEHSDEGGDEPHDENMHLVDFVNARWEIDGITVIASCNDLDLQVGPVAINKYDVIKLENIDSSKMQVRVYAEDGFSALLDINGDGEVSLFRTIEDCFLPYNLSFVVEEKPQEEVKGDINSDGEVNIIDVVIARAHIVGNSILNLSQIADGDMNDDGTLDIVDVVIMRSIIVNG